MGRDWNAKAVHQNQRIIAAPKIAFNRCNSTVRFRVAEGLNSNATRAHIRHAVLFVSCAVGDFSLTAASPHV